MNSFAARVRVCLLPAKYEMSIQAPSVHTSVFRVQHPAPQASGEVGRCLSSLLGLWAAVGGEQRERGACGDRVGAAGVLFPQVLSNDAVEGWRGRKVVFHLLFHCWSLTKREERVRALRPCACIRVFVWQEVLSLQQTIIIILITGYPLNF